MGIQNITWEMVVTCVAMILCILAGYNTFATARKNRREEEERRRRPTLDAQEEIAEQLRKHTEWLASDKTRIETLERKVDGIIEDTRDIHAAQDALCYGVQSLLEHAIHNGNEDEMINASKELNKYLRSRRTASYDES